MIPNSPDAGGVRDGRWADAFEPTFDLDLDSSSRLTSYTELHGCSCKLDQDELERLLNDTGISGDSHDLDVLLDVGEDASAYRITDERAAVSSVDFFTPIVDDPYAFGRVAGCNAMSDVFATGAIDDLRALAILCVPVNLPSSIVAAILSGLEDAVASVGGLLLGGHTILNPWPIAGASVTASTEPSAILTTADAQPDDVLYLTKPLGTQAAMGGLRVRGTEFEGDVRAALNGRELADIATRALGVMTLPNDHAARVARMVGVNAATDVTGFGVSGQAHLIARNSGVRVHVKSLPVLEGTLALSDLFGYGLEAGTSAETSGGLLLSIPAANVEALEAEFEDEDVFYHRIGRVEQGSGVQLDDPTVVPV